MDQEEFFGRMAVKRYPHRSSRTNSKEAKQLALLTKVRKYAYLVGLNDMLNIAESFGAWCSDNNWVKEDSQAWYHPDSEHGHTFTHVFNLFLNEQTKTKENELPISSNQSQAPRECTEDSGHTFQDCQPS